MNKGCHTSQHVLHVFDPTMLRRPHDEVEFVEGRYLDIAKAKGKDPHTLYFGTSQSSKLLAGIFLGDNELTSRVKDVSIVSQDGAVTLSIKYINENGKLGTVKTALPSYAAFEEIRNIIKTSDTSINSKFDASFVELKERIDIIDSSVAVIDSSIADIYGRLDIIDSSVNLLLDSVKTLDSSYALLIDDLDTGKYNYTIHKEVGDFTTGFKETYTLFKGENPAVDSSSIEITDLSLKRLEYDKEQNQITAKIWPSAIDDINLVEDVATLADGTVISGVTKTLDPNLVKEVSLDMTDIDNHINEFMNIDSSINDRLTIVETQLKWETLK